MNIIPCKQEEAMLKNLQQIPIHIRKIEYDTKTKDNRAKIYLLAIIPHPKWKVHLLKYFEISITLLLNNESYIEKEEELLILQKEKKRYSRNFLFYVVQYYTKEEHQKRYKKISSFINLLKENGWKEVWDCDVCPKEKTCKDKLTHYVLDIQKWRCRFKHDYVYTFVEVLSKDKIIKDYVNEITEYLSKNFRTIEDNYFTKEKS